MVSLSPSPRSSGLLSRSRRDSGTPFGVDLAFGLAAVPRSPSTGNRVVWGLPVAWPLVDRHRLGSKVRLQVLSSVIAPLEFRSANRGHVKEVVTSLKPSEHSQTMFEEILEECKLGRVTGPFSVSKLLLEDTSSCASRAFRVVQAGKVRRADDWLRSKHNATVWVTDSPAYARPDTLASCIQSAAQDVAQRSGSRGGIQKPPRSHAQ